MLRGWYNVLILILWFVSVIVSLGFWCLCYFILGVLCVVSCLLIWYLVYCIQMLCFLIELLICVFSWVLIFDLVV